MHARIPSAAFQWMTFGVDQPLTTDRTALDISGRVEIAKHIKPPSSSRKGQLSGPSSPSNSSNFTATLSGVLCAKVTRICFTNSFAKLCWEVVRVPPSRSLEWRHPPCHLNSPTFLTGIVRFKSTHYCHIFPSVLPQKYHRRAQLL